MTKGTERVKTARDYRYAIDRHLLPRLGALQLDEITSGVLNRLGARLKGAGYAGATVNNYMNLAALLLGYAVELDVIADLPLKKKLKKQKANKPCLELNADERARFLAAFDDEAGFRRFLAETMPKAKPTQSNDGRFGSRRAYGAGMRSDSDAAHAYFLRFNASKDLFVVALETGHPLGRPARAYPPTRRFRGGMDSVRATEDGEGGRYPDLRRLPHRA
jgi:hypothetical protein